MVWEPDLDAVSRRAVGAEVLGIANILGRPDLLPRSPLSVRLDLVIAAVPFQEQALAEILKSGARFLGLAPKTLADIYTDIATIAGAVFGLIVGGRIAFWATIWATRDTARLVGLPSGGPAALGRGPACALARPARCPCSPADAARCAAFLRPCARRLSS